MLTGRIERDLIIVCSLTIALILIVSTFQVSLLRIIFGFPFILFSPGYVLSALLFPKKSDIGISGRIASSLGLSIPAVIFIGLLVSFTPWGINLYSILYSVSAFIFIVSAVVWFIRRRISPEGKFGISYRQSTLSLYTCLKTASASYRITTITLVCAILIGCGTISYITAQPLPRQPFTEFHILGTEGQAGDFPQQLRPGEEGEVLISIANREHREMDYILEIMADGDRQSEINIQLKSEGKWEQSVGFTVSPVVPVQKVEFVLQKGNGQTPETRYLWITVKE